MRVQVCMPNVPKRKSALWRSKLGCFPHWPPVCIASCVPCSMFHVRAVPVYLSRFWRSHRSNHTMETTDFARGLQWSDLHDCSQIAPPGSQFGVVGLLLSLTRTAWSPRRRCIVKLSGLGRHRLRQTSRITAACCWWIVSGTCCLFSECHFN